MPGDAAAVNRPANIAECKVQRMALEVVNKERMSSHTQAFAGEPNNVSKLQVMHKQRAAYGVKAVIAEGKRQRVPTDGRMVVAQMSRSAVQNHRLRRDA